MTEAEIESAARDLFEMAGATEAEAGMTEEQARELIERCSYHAPTHHAPTVAGMQRHAELTEGFVGMLGIICATVPPGRDRALTLTKLEETMFHASAGVARNPKTR